MMPPELKSNDSYALSSQTAKVSGPRVKSRRRSERGMGIFRGPLTSSQLRQLVAQHEAHIEMVLQHVREGGPPLARIDSLRVDWEETTSYNFV